MGTAARMTTKLATATKYLWRIAMFSLFCYSQWECYLKWAEDKIATASTTRQSPYQKPFSISLCPVDYRMPDSQKEMVKVSNFRGACLLT